MVSMEIRAIISEDNKLGIPVKEMSTVLRIPIRTVENLLKHERDTGSMAPMPHKGRKPALDVEGLKRLSNLIDAHSDMTLNEIEREMDRDIDISALSRIIHHKLGYNLKKKAIHATERDTPKNKAKRVAFIKEMPNLAASHLVFLDESGVNTGMTRRYGRAKGKKRVCDSAPFNHKKNTTLIAAIRLGGKPVTGKIVGSMRGGNFLEYLTKALVPVLNKGAVVILDNLQTHKVKGVAEAVRGDQASILYLPPYSPDLNPIEEMWSKVKSYSASGPILNLV
jgi:transposase